MLFARAQLISLCAKHRIIYRERATQTGEWSGNSGANEWRKRVEVKAEVNFGGNMLPLFSTR